MHDALLLSLTGIIVLGIGAQWLAWRLRMPAILLLLGAGFLAGPAPELLGLGKLIDPDALLGDLLGPVVSLAVAVVLFEGGLTLDLAELPGSGRVIRNLVTLGAAITWVVGAVAGYAILGLSWPLATLLGAILTVTGPTVIGPLLRHIKPGGAVGPILRWEGIVIDPIGATLAVLVFEAIPLRQAESGLKVVIGGGISTVVIGGLIGLAGAVFLVVLLRRFWIPDYLESPATLMTVLAASTAANLLRDESGLFAVTVLGVVLANQRQVAVRRIVEFKEDLTVLLVSALFVVLGARLSADQVAAVGLPSVLFALVLIGVARPLAVAACTAGSGLSRGERIFLALLAPRGIVAAAVASVFAIRLREAGFAGADRLIPATFTVIVVTVTFYGLVAPLAARRLGLTRPVPGFLIAGGNPVAQAIARALHAEGCPTLLVDTRAEELRSPRLAGLPVLHASILAEYVLDRLDLARIGRLLALTPNAELNALAAVHYAPHFGRQNVFQLAAEPDPDRVSPREPPGSPFAGLLARLAPTADRSRRLEKLGHELRGRTLFARGATYDELAARLAAGATVKKTPLTEAFTFADYRARHGDAALPLFLITDGGRIEPFTTGAAPAPVAGQSILSLVTPVPGPATAPPARA